MKSTLVLAFLLTGCQTHSSNHHVTGRHSHLINQAATRFRYQCPCCGQIQIDKAVLVNTNGSVKVNGGALVERSGVFKCTNERCQLVFKLPIENMFVPAPMPAVEVKPETPQTKGSQ